MASRGYSSPIPIDKTEAEVGTEGNEGNKGLKSEHESFPLDGKLQRGPS
jgi:hypothetical protein